MDEEETLGEGEAQNRPIGEEMKIKDPKLELYRRVLLQVWEDGIVTSDEYAIMERIREGLNITLEEHLELESEVYMSLARQDFEKVHHQEAMELYDAAIAQNPRNKLAWMNKGFHLQSLERFDEALDCFDHALEIDPSNVHALTVRGCSLDMLKRYEEAVGSFLKAIELKADDEWMWYNLGLAYYHNGDNEKAREAFQKAVELKPEFTGPSKYLEMLTD